MNQVVISLNELSELVEAHGTKNAGMPRVSFSSEFEIGKKEIEEIRALARKLETQDRVDDAYFILQQVREQQPDHEWLGFHTCRLAIVLEKKREAREIFSRFGQDSTDQRWMLLGCILSGLESDQQRCFEQTQRYTSAIPTIVRSAKIKNAPTICVLKQRPLFITRYAEHFDRYVGGNGIGQFVHTHANDFNVRGFLVDTDTATQALGMIPAPDVIFNNIATGEHFGDPAILKGAEACIEHWGIGCINNPLKVYKTARDKNTANFADLTDVIYPKTAFFGMNDEADVEGQVQSIEASHDYPMILRPPAKQDGTGMTLIKNRSELTAFVSQWPRGIFAIEYLENKHGNLFRKMRAVFIGGKLHLIRVDHGEDWMLHGHRDQPNRISFYNDHPELLERERAICLDPQKELGSKAIKALESINKTLDLEFLGIDFDLTDDGRIVVFEANPAMNIVGKRGTKIPHPAESENAAMRDFKKLITGFSGN